MLLGGGMAGFAGPPSNSPTHVWLDAIENVRLTTSLKLCLDAGNASSVASGSQTKWVDVSGNGYDFFRGTTAASQTSDPTFNGSLGGQSSSEYYSFDGGDRFTYDTANEPFMLNMHKDNAKFWAAAWIYRANSVGTSFYFFGTRALDGTTTGVDWGTSANDVLRYRVNNGSSIVVSNASTTKPLNNAWNFVAMSVDEAAGSFVTGIGNANGWSSNSQACTYSSPSAGAAGGAFTIGGDYNGVSTDTGQRIAILSVGEGVAVSNDRFNDLFTATRGRFGV